MNTLIVERNASRQRNIRNLESAVSANEKIEVAALALQIKASSPKDFGFSRKDLEYFVSYYLSKSEAVQKEASAASEQLGKLNTKLSKSNGVGINPRDINMNRAASMLLRSIQARRDKFAKMQDIIQAEILRRGGECIAEKTPAA